MEEMPNVLQLRSVLLLYVLCVAVCIGNCAVRAKALKISGTGSVDGGKDEQFSEILSKEECFTAAVFERATEPLAPSISLLPMKNRIERAFSQYQDAVEFVSRQGADIIVFPEYGIMNSQDRAEVAPFLDDLPDPRQEGKKIVPCDSPHQFVKDSIIARTSCLSRRHRIYIVLNTIDRKPCQRTNDPKCPEVGEYRYNTNVVFDRDGTYIVRYHKAHLFLEYMVDAARVQEPAFFDTDFGRIGTFTCFDVLFKESVELVEKNEIDTIAFTTWWKEELPFFASIQFQHAWAIVNNVNFIAANTHSPDQAAVGSGIYSGNEGAIDVTHEISGNHQLLLARLPIRRYGNKTGRCPQPEFQRNLYPNDPVIPSVYKYGSNDLSGFKFKPLVERRGCVEECNEGVCCSVSYEFDRQSSRDQYVLVVHNGTKNALHIHKWCEEVCAVLRCNPRGNGQAQDRYCSGTFALDSESTFRRFQLSGRFSTKYVHPSILGPQVRLYSKDDFKFTVNSRENTATLKIRDSRNPRPLLVGSLYGRCYQRDPAYVRRTKPPNVDF